MTLQEALKEQYHAGIAMLRDCVEKCPDDLWLSGTYPRTFWRIAFHAIYFTQLYLGQTDDAFEPWPGRPQGGAELWETPRSVEPYELSEEFVPYTKAQLLDYIAYVDSLLDPTVDALDLEALETGIPWYKNMTKLSHELLNLRHLQGHVGQLSELLMIRGIDTNWIGKVRHP